MHRSFRHKFSLSLAAVMVIIASAGCASRQPEAVPRAIPPPVRRGSLAITNGIRILRSVELPTGFTPDPAYRPIWLEQGTEVGVAGTVEAKSALLGFSGPQMANQRIIAMDFGIGAPRGRVLGVAPSTIGPEFAIAIAEPTENRVKVVVRSGPTDDDGRTVAMISGDFAGAQLEWIDATTIAMALQGAGLEHVNLAEPANASGVHGAAGLYLINIAEPPTTHVLARIHCSASRLSFSPSGRLAVAQGDVVTPPALIDLRRETCVALSRRDPIRVIAWAPDESSFLYVARGKGEVPGAFRYDRTSAGSVVVAIASGAAAYASDGAIIALGNERLSWDRARTASRKAMAAKIALWSVGQEEITINSLGFETTPELLARASMIFAPRSDDGLIDVATLKASGPMRELIEYSYPARAAFVLATTSLDAAIGMSWSPDGKLIALVDGSAQPKIMTVIAPPR
jgi:hypothetical protein